MPRVEPVGIALGGDAFELVARIPHQPAIGVADRERARAISIERVVDQPAVGAELRRSIGIRSEEHTSELQSLMRISYAVFCLKKKKHKNNILYPHQLKSI